MKRVAKFIFIFFSVIFFTVFSIIVFVLGKSAKLVVWVFDLPKKISEKFKKKSENKLLFFCRINRHQDY
jgi:hypothetical protein